jgi:hypothetical protein
VVELLKSRVALELCSVKRLEGEANKLKAELEAERKKVAFHKSDAASEKSAATYYADEYHKATDRIEALLWALTQATQAATAHQRQAEFNRGKNDNLALAS